MYAVIDPQSLAPIRFQLKLAQLRQVSGYVQLGGTDGRGQLADTELIVLHEQHQAA